MGITRLNPACRIIFLSGTLGNAEQIALWLKSLNGKETKCVKSNWTPCKINKSVELTGSYNETYGSIKKYVSENAYQKSLIFVHSKKFGEKIVRQLLNDGIACAFYHADLDKERKKKIAKRFKDDYGDINVLISTSALGMGLNL